MLHHGSSICSFLVVSSFDLLTAASLLGFKSSSPSGAVKSHCSVEDIDRDSKRANMSKRREWLTIVDRQYVECVILSSFHAPNATYNGTCDGWNARKG